MVTVRVPKAKGRGVEPCLLSLISNKSWSNSSRLLPGLTVPAPSAALPPSQVSAMSQRHTCREHRVREWPPAAEPAASTRPRAHAGLQRRAAVLQNRDLAPE